MKRGKNEMKCIQAYTYLLNGCCILETVRKNHFFFPDSAADFKKALLEEDFFSTTLHKSENYPALDIDFLTLPSTDCSCR
jgi:hypothetical protein